MKKLFVAYFCLLSSLALSATDKPEKITLRAHYGFVTAGYADWITCQKSDTLAHTRLEFKTTSLVDKLFRFVYVFDSYYDSVDCYPEEFSYDLVEKKRSFNDTILYYHDRKYLKTGKHGKMAFDKSPRDLLSVISYLRKIDWSTYKENESVSFDLIFREKEIFPIQVYYQGKEKVSVGAGDYDCIKLYLTSEAGKLFISESKVAIYLSDDGDKLPVSFSIDVFLGSFKLDMVGHE